MSTGQQVIRADLIESGDKGAARLQLILPPVFFVPAGVKVRFGDDSTDIPYLWCVSNACVAAGRIEARLVEQMTALEQFIIECIDTSLLGISATIPLANFQEAHEGAPTRSFNEALEETQ
jgi:invasion protein IalB